MSILLAVVLGTAFGFVLQRVGATDTRKIWGMLTLQDLHLAKAILLAIGISCAVLFTGLATGIIEVSHLSVKSSYNGVLIGGLILGAGWAIAGYCPGTGVAAAGEGKKDALVYLLGGLLGAWIYTLTYPLIKDGWLFNTIAGGKAMLADVGRYHALLPSVSALLVGLIAAAVFVAIAALLPKKLR